MMRASVEQFHAELPLETLDLLAESGLDNVLASCGPPEVELLSERYEEPELTELQGAPPHAQGDLHPVCLPNSALQPRRKCPSSAYLGYREYGALAAGTTSGCPAAVCQRWPAWRTTESGQG